MIVSRAMTMVEEEESGPRDRVKCRLLWLLAVDADGTRFSGEAGAGE